MDEILLKKYADVENCPVRNVLDRFGDKWSTLVLLVLDDVAVMKPLQHDATRRNSS